MVMMTAKVEIFPVIEMIGGNRSEDLAVFRVEPDGVALTAPPSTPARNPGTVSP